MRRGHEQEVDIFLEVSCVYGEEINMQDVENAHRMTKEETLGVVLFDKVVVVFAL